MTEHAPLRNRRVKAVRCPVEGHPHCEVAKTGDTMTRSQERAEWLRDHADEVARAYADQWLWMDA